MIRQKNMFVVAIAGSLGLHLASMGLFVEYARWAGWGSREQAASAKGKQIAQTQPDEELIVFPDMGDAQGTGIGSNSSPGDQPQLAREADEDQALLSRNPQGAGRITAKPTDRRGPVGDGRGGAPAQATPAPAPAPKPQVAVTPAPSPAEESAKPIEKAPMPQAAPSPAVVLISPKLEPKTAPPPSPVAKQPPVASAVVQPEESSHPDVQSATAPKVQVAVVLPPVEGPEAPQADSEAKAQDAKPVKAPVQERPAAPREDGAASAKPQAAQTGDGRRAGVPPPPGNPLPQSESDSDPFSRISGNIIVSRAGRLDVRMGRKVKTTRPQVNVAGEIDLIALNNPTVILEVHIAPSGNVTDVKIAHSSGSNAIDEPTRVAIYDWWFEPAHDKSGKPVADVIFFAVRYL